MLFWSKGLGRRRYLVMEIGREEVLVEGPRVILRGRVREPVSWKYTMTLEGDDWDKFFRVAFASETARYLGRTEHLRELVQLTGFLARFVAGFLAALLRVKLLDRKPTGSPATESLEQPESSP